MNKQPANEHRARVKYGSGQVQLASWSRGLGSDLRRAQKVAEDGLETHAFTLLDVLRNPSQTPVSWLALR